MARTILALDIGDKRIGVARADRLARLPEPLEHIEVDGDEVERIRELIDEHDVDHLVIGLPRGLQGQETKQTHKVHNFVSRLKRHLRVPIDLQDEALTSHHAEAELKRRRRSHDKGDVDSLAAAYILEDYLRTTP